MQINDQNNTRLNHLISQWLRKPLGVLIALVLALIVALITATSAYSGQILGQHLDLLFYSGVVAVGLLLAILLLLIIELIINLRQKQFGSRLTAKLTLMLSLFALIPGFLLFAVSLHFLANSLESWFHNRVENALETSVALINKPIEQEKSELLTYCNELVQLVETQKNSTELTTKSRNKLNNLARGLLTSKQIDSLSLISIDKQNPEKELTTLVQYGPSSSLLAHSNDWWSALSTLEPWHTLDTQTNQTNLIIINPRPWPAPASAQQNTTLFCQISHQLSEETATQIKSIQQGREDYQILILGRVGLRKLFGVTLTLIFLLGGLISLVAALRFSQRLIAPLLNLVAGTHKAGRGEYKTIPVIGKDEIAALTGSFNNMLSTLESARRAVDEKQTSLHNTNKFLRMILEEVRAGVLILDTEFTVISTNPAAAALLNIPEQELPNMGMKEISKLYACSRDLQQSFLQIRAQNKGSFVKEITMPTHTINNNAVPNESATWLFRGSWLPEMNLALLLFEDVSDLMSARKTQAWAEVAQRLAHEIRNPLMPIRLTAERLQMKLSDKLKGADAAMLTKGTNTIINQVDALKMLVEALRSMGDGMPLQRQRIDLISILQEVKTLYDAHPNLTIELQTNVEHAWVLADADRMRQVFHNLVKNAVESATLKPNAKVKLTISQNDTLIEIQVEDNGAGFQKQMLQKAFEPYLTTKSTGTGLGLAIVKKIIDEHEAKIELFNCESDQGKITGARVSLFFTVLPQ